MALTGRAALLALLGVLPVLVLPSAWTVLAVALLLAVVAVVDALLATPVGALQLSRSGATACRLGEQVEVALSVVNPGPRHLRGVLRDAWVPSAGASPRTHDLDVPVGQRRSFTTVLQPTRRGDRYPDRVTVRSVGPLGVAARQGGHDLPWRVRVQPPFASRRHLPERLARLRQLDGAVAVRQRGQGTEFDTLRDYVEGDDVRSIDWRATARRQEVVVRTWRPERDRTLLLVLDTSRTSAGRVGDVPRLDAALDAALLLTALASRAGDRVDLLAFDREPRGAVEGAGRQEVLRRSVDVMSGLEPALVEGDGRRLVGEVLQRTRRRSLVVLFTSLDTAALEEGLLPHLTSLTSRHTVLLAAVADPRVEAMAVGRGTPQAVYEAAAAERARTERRRLTALLRRRGVEVVDAPPERFAPAVSDAYLGLKAAGRLQVTAAGRLQVTAAGRLQVTAAGRLQVTAAGRLDVARICTSGRRYGAGMTTLLDTTARQLLARTARAQATSRVPSLVAGVVRGGALAWSAGRGAVEEPHADVQHRLGSISKTVTAVAVMRLRDEGLVQLDDPVDVHLPGTPFGSRTVGQLLSHTAGLRSEAPGAWWERVPGPPWTGLQGQLTDADVPHGAGRRFHYSNLGYGVLGELLARLRGRPWAEVVRDEVLLPLGMDRTTPRPQGRAAQGWAVHPWADVLLPEPEEDAGAMAAAGQLWASLTDLGRFAAFLLGDTADVLSSDTLEEMASPAGVDPSSTGWSAYGLGLQVVRLQDRTLVGHGGSMPGFLASVFVDRGEDLGTVVLCNATSGLDPALVGDLHSLVRTAEPHVPEPWRAAETLDTELLALAGTWYWGTYAYGLRLRSDGVLDLTGIAGAGRASRFRARGDGTFVGLDGYHAGEVMRVVREAGVPVALDLGSFVFSRTPYDPAAPHPGGVAEGGWRGTRG